MQGKVEDCTIPPMMSEPDSPSQQSDHPAETEDPNQDITHPATGTDLAVHLAGTPTDPKARALPHYIQADPPDTTGDAPPTSTFKMALRWPQHHPQQTAVIPLRFPREGSLLTDCTSDSQVAFCTMLQLATKNGNKHMTFNIDLGTKANSIPLSKYWIFPKK